MEIFNFVDPVTGEYYNIFYDENSATQQMTTNAQYVNLMNLPSFLPSDFLYDTVINVGIDTPATVYGDNLSNFVRVISSVINYVDVGKGNDTIDGSGATAQLTAHGQNGNDLIQGGAVRDFLYGEIGRDSISGGKGSDFIYGGIGNDLIYGENGSDFIEGGSGYDRLVGGLGHDRFIFNSYDSMDGDEIIDFESGVDIIKIAATDYSLSYDGTDTTVNYNNGYEYVIVKNVELVDTDIVLI